MFIAHYFTVQAAVESDTLVQVQKLFKTQYPEITFKLDSSSNYNAYATWTKDNKPQIVFTKGVLNHNLMNKNVLMLLICHELGHFYGHSPKQKRGRSNKESWSSAEGQADFYATAVCMKKFKNDSANKNIQLNPEICQTTTCQSTLNASLTLTQIFAEIKFWSYGLSIFEKDFSVAYSTIFTHPNPQCRLDTLIAGLRCKKILKTKGNAKTLLTCEDKEFAQPACWFSSSTFEDTL